MGSRIVLIVRQASLHLATPRDNRQRLERARAALFRSTSRLLRNRAAMIALRGKQQATRLQLPMQTSHLHAATVPPPNTSPQLRKRRALIVQLGNLVLGMLARRTRRWLAWSVRLPGTSQA